MGMNYYAVVDGQRHHIGKRSKGWAFALHVGEEVAGVQIRDLDDWERVFAFPNVRVLDEYGDPADLAIRDQPFHRRQEIDGTYCIAHGAGSWDLVVGRFS